MNSDRTRGSEPDPLRSLARWIFVLACLATIVALFYVEENWRGRRAWQKCRHELEARGARLNWDTFIPPAVPDEQNIFKAPRMQGWFVKGSLPARGWSSPGKDLSVTGRVYLAEVKIVPATLPVHSETADAALRIGDPGVAEKSGELLQKALGPSFAGAQSLTLLARVPAEIAPVRLVVETDNAATVQELRPLFSVTNLLAGASVPVHIEPAASNQFLIYLNLPRACYTAADFLAWSKQIDPDLELIREALQRPYARMDGNYQQPSAMPIPNFVAIRNIVQIIAESAQCHLLLRQPEAALNKLTLLDQMCRLLEAAPTHEPMTLVAAMINVAVRGLYADVIADGARLGAWREPQLKALQQQLESMDLLPYLRDSIICERAASCRTFATIKPAALNNIFSFGSPRVSFWDYVRNPESLLPPLIPRGWMFQNMCTLASVQQKMIDSLNNTNFVSPKRVEASNSEGLTTRRQRSPYRLLAAVAVPNIIRAAQIVARTQSLLRQGAVACALERYRLAHGEYPERLEMLVPDLISTIPGDVIEDAALRYRRAAPNAFLLYSIGWNERDDGGVPGKTVPEGDWVWRGSAQP